MRLMCCLLALVGACAQGSVRLDRKLCEVVGRADDVSTIAAAGPHLLVISGPLALRCPCGGRTISGSTDGRQIGGSTEGRRLSGAVEDRRLAGATEARSLAGATENRSLAGATESRQLAGGTEQRGFGGNAEDRGLAGQSEPLACFEEASCSGYWVTGAGPLSVFDGKLVTPLAGRCVP